MASTPPKSVKAIDKWPGAPARAEIGTKLNQLIKFARQLYTRDFTASGGGLLDLINEIRTDLDTGGDVFALVNDLRDMLDNICLSNPTVVQNTGGSGATHIEISAATDYKIAGAFYQKGITQDIATTAGWNTGAGEYRAVLIELDSAGAVSFVITPVAGAAPVALPAKTAGKCAIASVQVPENFTSGVTNFLTAWVTNGTPTGSAALSALTASAVAASTETLPEDLPDTDM